jgi:NADH:ubiquinone oxidoreductase subunit 6 (subunit J)
MRFGQPVFTTTGRDDLVGSALFWLFATGAVGFALMLVTQRNPARGAIAFAFVVLSTCGLFLLLAAPFLMAATIIIYAGAIVVTFLFVLMLSQIKGLSDENDRTREPLLGSLAGFAFVGLLLFTLHLSAPESGATENTFVTLPAEVLTRGERTLLDNAIQQFDLACDTPDWATFQSHSREALVHLDSFFAPRDRLPPEERTQSMASYPSIAEFRSRTERLVPLMADLRPLVNSVQPVQEARPAVKLLRDELAVYRGQGLLPARNVANLGYLIYSEYLIAVEMAGTLLLVATIGAVAIAQRRKGVPA